MVDRRSCLLSIGLAAMLMTVDVPAARGQATSDLKRMTLQELMDVELTTFSRTPAPVSEIPAATYIITSDDIRRSGAVSLPQILRLAPGIQVSRIDSSRYAIGIRGFPDRLSRAILVMVDGRAVYSPLFAGTYWEVQDTYLEDIDRIEVIRGPGGTLWGANAVNGIINIITKSAKATQGTVVSLAAGSDLTGPFSGRFGGGGNGPVQWRVYGKGVDVDPQSGAAAGYFDTWRTTQAGFRADWTNDQERALTVQGDVYVARQGQRFALASYTPPFTQTFARTSRLSGGNVVARLSGPFRGGDFQLQTYYDRTSRDERPVAETRNTFDGYFQHRPHLSARHDIIWGLGARLTSDDLVTVGLTTFTPTSRTDGLYSLFAQDDFSLRPSRLRVVLGARVDHNAYSDWEVQPSARVVWTLAPDQSVIGSVTRAVRTPSRVETDYATSSLSNPALPSFVRLQSNPDFVSEKLVVYEAGYRVRIRGAAYVTFAGFFNQLNDVLSADLRTPFVEATPPPVRVILPVVFANGLHGNSQGAELTGDWRVASWLRTTGSYSYARLHLSRNPGSTDLTQERNGEGLTPRHQAQLGTSIDLPSGLELEWMWRYVAELPTGPVPAYNTSNLRLSWQLTHGLEAAIVGQHLHDPHHPEWTGRVEVQRSAYASLTWRQ